MMSTSTPATRIQTSSVGGRPKTPNRRFGTNTRSTPKPARYQPNTMSERATADMAPPVERKDTLARTAHYDASRGAAEAMLVVNVVRTLLHVDDTAQGSRAFGDGASPTPGRTSEVLEGRVVVHRDDLLRPEDDPALAVLSGGLAVHGPSLHRRLRHRLRRRPVGCRRDGLPGSGVSALDLERAHHRRQLFRLPRELRGGRGGLLRAGRVLLRHLTDLRHGLVHLLDSRRLLLGRGGDLRHDLADLAHRGADLRQPFVHTECSGLALDRLLHRAAD